MVVVAAVRGGLLSFEEACQRYTLTTEEFLSWQQSIDQHGLARPRAAQHERRLAALLLVLGRPPPWLALPPMLAICRCFSALIAAKPRFEPPELLLFEPGMLFLLMNSCEYEPQTHIGPRRSRV